MSGKSLKYAEIVYSWGYCLPAVVVVTCERGQNLIHWARSMCTADTPKSAVLNLADKPDEYSL